MTWAMFIWNGARWEFRGITQFDEFVTEWEETVREKGKIYEVVALETPALEQVPTGDLL